MAWTLRGWAGVPVAMLIACQVAACGTPASLPGNLTDSRLAAQAARARLETVTVEPVGDKLYLNQPAGRTTIEPVGAKTYITGPTGRTIIEPVGDMFYVNGPAGEARIEPVGPKTYLSGPVDIVTVLRFGKRSYALEGGALSPIFAVNGLKLAFNDVGDFRILQLNTAVGRDQAMYPATKISLFWSPRL
ncbi:MAG: hypothetical protein H7338_17715 [Candidatus Sericytochromatia bacterium]|nr:hypothetical protein [Candidatus Sericytochromatia bacterium]